MNNYKNFITYFKRSDSIASTGLGLLATGGILLLLGWWFFWLLFYIAVVMIPIGLVIYIYGTSGSADENSLNKIIKENYDAITFSDIKEMPEYRRRMLKKATEEALGGYVFGDNVLMKRAKSSAIVSTEYVCAKMLILEDALLIRSRSFSFIADERHESELEIPLSSIEKIEIERESQTYQVGKKELVVKTCFIVISHEGSQTRLPRKDDIYADELILTLNRLLKKA
ncbi:MAG: hypothetical protein E7584_08140 [Ruminococcaceae bacterium]|nr:hypothetical protein [Oscillospiraceae bacterium]